MTLGSVKYLVFRDLTYTSELKRINYLLIEDFAYSILVVREIQLTNINIVDFTFIHWHIDEYNDWKLLRNRTIRDCVLDL